MSGGLDVDAEAARILDAHARRATLDPISDRGPLSLHHAYAVQAQVTAARLARGERVVGWKLGYTSLVMREQMGVDAPNFGPLTDAMLVADGAAVPASMTQPRVEPEVALRFASDVPAGADRAAVLAAVGSAHAALEVVDSVWTGYRFTLEDNTADGSSAAGVVLGPELPLDRIADVEVTLLVDGEPAGTGRGSDASGHPADGVVWLVEQLAERGEHLRAGDVVITGGLTRAAVLDPGTVIEGVFDGTIRVSVARARAHRSAAQPEPTPPQVARCGGRARPDPPTSRSLLANVGRYGAGVIVTVVRFPMDPSQPADAVRSSFEASAPAYRSVPGLLRKHFLRAEDGSAGGGVYLWESRDAAEAWYTPEWVARVSQKFGVPQIDYFESPVTVDPEGITVG